MSVASLAGAGLPREDDGKWAGGGGVVACFGCFAGGETLERGLHGGEVVEGEETVGAAAELSGGLRATEHQEAEDGGLVAAEVQDGSDAMLVLGHAAVADGGGE